MKALLELLWLTVLLDWVPMLASAVFGLAVGYFVGRKSKTNLP